MSKIKILNEEEMKIFKIETKEHFVEFVKSFLYLKAGLERQVFSEESISDGQILIKVFIYNKVNDNLQNILRGLADSIIRNVDHRKAYKIIVRLVFEYPKSEIDKLAILSFNKAGYISKNNVADDENIVVIDYMKKHDKEFYNKYKVLIIWHSATVNLMTEKS